MPYKYIGKTTNTKGKTLWEIVGNLKNFGVGRIVVRSIFERYPEPSYSKILNVEPLPCPEQQTHDNVRKVRVLVERTFRGKTFPDPVTIESASYKADYRLIPKDEEESYCKKVTSKVEKPILPKFMSLPPLMEEFILREMKSKGEKVDESIKMEIVYQKPKKGKYRLAEDGETPTVTLEVNTTKLPDISLYKNIKVST